MRYLESDNLEAACRDCRTPFSCPEFGFLGSRGEFKQFFKYPFIFEKWPKMNVRGPLEQVKYLICKKRVFRFSNCTLINTSSTNLLSIFTSRPVFPFTSIIGQEEMKLALILNVIDPRIGGVMVMGDRGTGKSTTIRALIDVLPTIKVVKNDPFNSSLNNFELMSEDVRLAIERNDEIKIGRKKVPMIDLPLGATEDRVCGTIDIEKAITEGVKSFEPGLLAKANRGILYVDEVNLLDDHLVDILLDSAASGWNTVEREGISIKHPARFVLVGSGNPEEGDLRPQLLDRFGLYAEVRTVKDPKTRVEVVKKRNEFDKDPKLYKKLYNRNFSLSSLKEKIRKAQERLLSIKINPLLQIRIAQVCSELGVDGLRGDIVTNRASKAHAAWCGRDSVIIDDIETVVLLCLRHRLRKDPMKRIDSGYKVTYSFEEVFK